MRSRDRPGRELLLHHVTPRRGAPESTGAEAGYLVQAIESRGVFVVRLLDGSEMRGKLEGYDRDCLVLRLPAGDALMLRKAKVKYFWLEK